MMKINFPYSPFLFLLLVLSINFQSCEQLASSSDSSESDTTTETETTSNTDDTKTPPSTGTDEMSVQEQLDYAASHVKELTFVNEKIVDIKNEHIHHKDQFTFECDKGKVDLERIYNDDNQIHLLSYHIHGEDGISTKHHYFWDNKLIYQFHHHEGAEGGKQVIDDHKTYFKEGKIIRCLEKKISYSKGEEHPNDLFVNATYEQVDCVPADKLTKNIEQLLAYSEEEAKDYFCN